MFPFVVWLGPLPYFPPIFRRIDQGVSKGVFHDNRSFLLLKLVILLLEEQLLIHAII